MLRLFPDSHSIRRALGHGPLLGVIGSTSCHHLKTADACRQLGKWLASSSYTVVTGGLPGVPKEVCSGLGSGERAFHLLPLFWRRPATGKTIRTGLTLYGRRVKLARVCDIYVCIEGGPGTAHESRLVHEQNLPLIPLAVFGGHALVEWQNMPRPNWVQEHDWTELGQSSDNFSVAISAMTKILQSYELTYQRSDSLGDR